MGAGVAAVRSLHHRPVMAVAGATVTRRSNAVIPYSAGRR